MCRLYGFRANELTKVECSLVHAQNALLVQSRGDAIGRKHADGWGIACYGDLSQPGTHLPDLIRHETAAFDDAHFSHTAESTYAQSVVAHVRLATVGYVGTMNSHPFGHGGWTFAHNGTVPGFDQVGKELAEETFPFQNSRLGETDSEQLFLWLLNRIRNSGVDLNAPDITQTAQVIARSVNELDARCREAAPDKTPKMTFVLTNGQLMFGCCWSNTLYSLQRTGVHDCEICGIPHIRHDDSVEYRAQLFASEPITEEDWQEVENFTLMAVSADLQTTSFDIRDLAANTTAN